MNRKTSLMAHSAMLSALSVTLLYVSGLLPTLQLAMIALAGLLPAAAVIKFKTASGFYTYAVTALLSLLLLPEKSGALIYIFLFGCYPMLKSYIERLNSLFFEWVLKLLTFNTGAVILLLFFPVVFARAASGLTMYMPGILLIGNCVFVLYDIGFSKLIHAYSYILKKRI